MISNSNAACKKAAFFYVAGCRNAIWRLLRPDENRDEEPMFIGDGSGVAYLYCGITLQLKKI